MTHTQIQKHIFLIPLLLFISSSIGFSQSVASDIEQCKALEDDEPKAAIALAQQKLRLSDKNNDPLRYGQFLGCLGWAHTSLDQIEKARSVASDLHLHVSDLPIAKDNLHLLRRAGAIYHRIGARISAVEIYQQAMNMAADLNDESEKIPLLINLGVLNAEIENHETAIEDYYTALDLMDASQDFRFHVPVLYNLASTLGGQKRYEEALKIYKITEGLMTDDWPKTRKAQVYFGLAVSYEAAEDLDNALDYINKAQAIMSDLSEKSVFSYEIQIVQAIIELKRDNKKDFNQLADEARDFYLKPENEKALLGLNLPLISLAKVYELLDRPADALELYKLKHRLQKAFHKSFNKNYMAQMQHQLSETQKRAQATVQNQLLTEKSEKQKSLRTLIALFVASLLLLFLILQHFNNRKLKRMARTDSLTELGNRRSIRAWHNAHKLPKSPLARYMWLIDLDKFKAINDEFDHDVGDTALREVAKSLSKLVNKNRSLCRWGGEEFMLLTDDVTAAKKSEFSQLLLRTLSETDIASGSVQLNLTGSIGISEIMEHDRSAWRRALYEADKALYTAKDRGRNCAVMATAQA